MAAGLCVQSQDFKFESLPSRLMQNEISMFSRHILFTPERDSMTIYNSPDSFNLQVMNCECIEDLLQINCKTTDVDLYIWQSGFKLENGQKIEMCEDGVTIKSIDERYAYMDYNVDTPKTQVDSIQLLINTKVISIPKNSYKDLFDLVIYADCNHPIDVFRSYDKKRIYVYFMGGNNGYEATLIFKEGKYVGRVIYDYY
jgi:hypothetical protein